MSSSCFLISRKSEKSALVDTLGTAAAAAATETTEELAAIFLPRLLRPISGGDTSSAEPGEPVSHWPRLAPDQPITSLLCNVQTGRWKGGRDNYTLIGKRC